MHRPTAIAVHGFQSRSLDDWLINGYLPALDHWLNMGAPKPLTLVIDTNEDEDEDEVDEDDECYNDQPFHPVQG